jgi:hypothetical protein
VIRDPSSHATSNSGAHPFRNGAPVVRATAGPSGVSDSTSTGTPAAARSATATWRSSSGRYTSVSAAMQPRPARYSQMSQSPTGGSCSGRACSCHGRGRAGAFAAILRSSSATSAVNRCNSASFSADASTTSGPSTGDTPPGVVSETDRTDVHAPGPQRSQETPTGQEDTGATPNRAASHRRFRRGNYPRKKYEQSPCAAWRAVAAGRGGGVFV